MSIDIATAANESARLASETQRAREASEGERPEAFVAAITALALSDKGRLAALRRATGETLSSARDVAWIYEYLERYAPQASPWDEERFFLVATLLAGDRRELDRRSRKERKELKDIAQPVGHLSFAQCLARLKNEYSAAAIDRRFRILLDAQMEADGTGDLPFRLRQLVQLILPKNISIDWPQLLRDLGNWDDARRSVQKKWASQFYTTFPSLPVESDAGNAEGGSVATPA